MESILSQLEALEKMQNRERESLREAQKQNENLTKEAESVEISLRIAKKRSDQAKQNYYSTLVRLHDLDVRLEEISKENEKKSLLVAHLSENNNELGKKITDVQDTLDSEKAKCSKHLQTISNYFWFSSPQGKSFQDANKSIAEISDTLKNMKNSMKDAKQEYETLCEQEVSLKKAHQEKQQELFTAKRSLEQSNKNHGEKERIYNELVNQTSEKEEQFKKVHHENMSLKDHIAESSAHVTNLENECNRLEKITRELFETLKNQQESIRISQEKAQNNNPWGNP